jgi:hypothetical protein
VDDFLKLFMTPILKNMARLLSAKGVLALNVDNTSACPNLCEFVLKCAKTKGLQLVGTVGLPKGNKSTTGCEPVYIFTHAKNVAWARGKFQRQNVHQADAVVWLRKQPDQSLGHVVTGLPDMGDLAPSLTVDEYTVWVQRVFALLCQKCKPQAYIILIQTDRKAEGVWIDKTSIINSAAQRLCVPLRWHKIVLRQKWESQDMFNAAKS